MRFLILGVAPSHGSQGLRRDRATSMKFLYEVLRGLACKCFRFEV